MIVICIAFIAGKCCSPHAIRYVKIWPNGTKSLRTPGLEVGYGRTNRISKI